MAPTRNQVSGWLLLLAVTLAACIRSTTTAETVIDATAGPLWIRIQAPARDAVVSLPYVDVVGEAAPGTVISINDEIVVIESEPSFTVRVPLELGSNLIEIIASDAEDHQVTLTLVVTYEPED